MSWELIVGCQQAALSHERPSSQVRNLGVDADSLSYCESSASARARKLAVSRSSLYASQLCLLGRDEFVIPFDFKCMTMVVLSFLNRADKTYDGGCRTATEGLHGMLFGRAW